MRTLEIVAIVKDEARHLPEWLAFHEIVGVDRFFIYDNESTDRTRLILETWPTVTWKSWPGTAMQLPAYQDALLRLTTEESPADWVAFLDADEFLFAPSYAPIPTVLERYRQHAAVGVCWATYGASAMVAYPASRLISLTGRAAIGNPVNRHVKSIVQPALLPSDIGLHLPADPHHFDCQTVDTLGRPLCGPFAKHCIWDFLRINHYVSGSVIEATEKMRRRRADNGELCQMDLLAAELNKVPDFALAYYAELVNRRVAAVLP